MESDEFASDTETSDRIAALKAQLDRWTFRMGDEGPNTEAEIVAIEHRLGKRLPKDYRWFGLTYGGGDTNGALLSIQLDDGTAVEFDRLGDPHNIRFGNLLYQPPNFPPGLVPCAATLMSDVFFLRLDETHHGSVWYWGCYDGRNPHHDLVKAADSFTDLLASSVPGPNDD